METNYEVKPKKSLRPFKAGLLVLAMVCFVLGAFAQQGKTVRVADDQQFVKALKNPAMQTLVFESSYDGSSYFNSPTIMNAIKSTSRDEIRTLDCIYWIQENDTCFFDPDDDNGWVHNFSRAGTIDPPPPFGPCNCCPPANTGEWSWIENDNIPPPLMPHPTGGLVDFLDALNEEFMEFRVNKPGVYTLRYSWALPYNSHVQTEYHFWDQYVFDELDATDVCGLTTTVNMQISSSFGDPEACLTYWMVNECRDIWYPFAGPALEDLWYFSYTDTPPYWVIDNDTIQEESFQLTVPDFGVWWLYVSISPCNDNPLECGNVLDSVMIVFSREPVANAGPDAMVCEDLCYQLMGTTGLEGDECDLAPNFYHKWTKVSGPGLIGFANPYSLTTLVCRDEETCSYGQYLIALEVTNGECYDSDTMKLTFYEQPEANAGPNQYLCDTLCFTLDATDYQYCSPPIGNERNNYWQLISKPDPGSTLNWNPNLTDPVVCVIDGTCPWGEYKFRYVEINGTCIDYDTVSVFLFEQPIPDAGPDQSLCNDFAFSLDGSLDVPCNQMTVIGIQWSLVDQPDDCDVAITETNELDPDVYISNCETCPFGDYTFRLTQYNGYLNNAGQFIIVCTGYDDVTVCISQQPVANAGNDFSMCYDGGCFGLDATPFLYCNNELCGERFGKWTKVGGPAGVTFTDELDPESDACPDEDDDCVYGWYTFVWTETNGECVDTDTVEVTLYEPPTADAGDDESYCLDAEFSMQLWHTLTATPYEYCQETGFEEPYGYWSKCGGPGYVTFVDEFNPVSQIHVTAFGCYCFVWHEVNGDCEATDTVHVCWYEHPNLEGELSDSICLSDMPACYDLGLLDFEPYQYLPPPNVNYNHQGWIVIEAAGNVVFTDPEDDDTEVCIDQFGCYTFAFVQWNGEETCSDTAFVYLTYFEKPEADAGDDDEICGRCYDMQAVPYSYVVNECAPSETQNNFWSFVGYIPPQDPCPTDDFHPNYSANAVLFNADKPDAELCVTDDYCGTHYGTYKWAWNEVNLPDCKDKDTVAIEMKKKPDPVPLHGCIDYSNSCNNYSGWCEELQEGWDPDYCEDCIIQCLYPEDTVLTVCAESCLSFGIDWMCLYQSHPPNYSCILGPIPGYTYEWSFIGPAGSYFNADPLWWDCDAECWKGSDQINICFGECCDTARLYLTITTPEGCETTEEWKFFVQHRPDATISGPAVAEVSTIFEYSVPEPQNPCNLYIWEVEHCGEIVYGQGTGTIGVHWTDYNVNGGWGIVRVEVHDTCTGCCAMDDMMVHVFPQGTLGNATLSGHVYYHNNIMSPLNGVEVTLWNSGVPVFTTTSFNDIEGGNGVGYYKFTGISGVTNFGITASYNAPWYGANATDALAVELKVINNLPLGFLFDNVVAEAMDVNNSNSISATDALWIKQRAINMVNYFPAGNWVFEPGMMSTAGTYNIFTLNAGDANRSNIPASMKETPAITFVSDGVLNVKVGQEYELPIRVADANEFGAITLNLGFNPALIDVMEVTAMEGMLTSIGSGNVSIAWSNTSPMVLAENDVVVVLKVKALGLTSTGDELFTVGLGSEFADSRTKVIEPVTLKTYGISTEPAATDYFLSANRPNPFSTSTFIEYTLPETGKVKLSVLDMLGQELEVLVEATQSAGSYTVEYANPGLATGVYIYKITVDGETRDYVSTQRMIVTK